MQNVLRNTLPLFEEKFLQELTKEQEEKKLD